LYILYVFRIDSITDEHIDWLPYLATMNHSTVNTDKLVLLLCADLDSSDFILRSGTVGSYSSSSFSFLRKCYIDFHSDCIDLHSHQQCKSIPFCIHPHQDLLFYVFFIHLFVCAYIVWAISPPVPHPLSPLCLASRQNLFCTYFQFCGSEDIAIIRKTKCFC
jgi:hypothetical protein